MHYTALQIWTLNELEIFEDGFLLIDYTRGLKMLVLKRVHVQDKIAIYWIPE